MLSAHSIPKHLLFDISNVREALPKLVCDGRSLKTPYKHQPLKDVLNHRSEGESVVSDINSELDANPPSSPGIHPLTPKEKITFQMLKDIVSERPMKTSNQRVKDAKHVGSKFFRNCR